MMRGRRASEAIAPITISGARRGPSAAPAADPRPQAAPPASPARAPFASRVSRPNADDHRVECVVPRRSLDAPLLEIGWRDATGRLLPAAPGRRGADRRAQGRNPWAHVGDVDIQARTVGFEMQFGPPWSSRADEDAPVPAADRDHPPTSPPNSPSCGSRWVVPAVGRLCSPARTALGTATRPQTGPSGWRAATPTSPTRRRSTTSATRMVAGVRRGRRPRVHRRPRRRQRQDRAGRLRAPLRGRSAPRERVRRTRHALRSWKRGGNARKHAHRVGPQRDPGRTPRVSGKAHGPPVARNPSGILAKYLEKLLPSHPRSP